MSKVKTVLTQSEARYPPHLSDPLLPGTLPDLRGNSAPCRTTQEVNRRDVQMFSEVGPSTLLTSPPPLQSPPTRGIV